MNTLTRGVRNAFRNSIRTVSIVVILGLSIGLALCMVIARQAVTDKITSVKASVGTTVTISPAGARGFEGGGTPLTNDQIASLKKLDNVLDVTATLSDRLTTDNTNLESAVEAGALGRRNSETNGTQFEMRLPEGMQGSEGDSTRTFTPPVQVTGTNSLANASVYGGSTVTYTSGEAFDPSIDEDVAVVGKSLAEKNSLSVGSTFTAYDATIQVVGIYDTGTEFSNNGLIIPLVTLQRLSDQTDAVTAATVTLKSVDNLSSVTTAIKDTLGSTADVVSSEETADAIVAPLTSVKTIASYSLIAALAAGAVIILLTMVMIVRERRREIGVMKAIGSSNITTTAQFMVESMTLTILGLVLGLGIALAASMPITNAMVSANANSSQSSQTTSDQGMQRGGPRQLGRNFQTSTRQSLETLQTAVGWSTLGQGVLVALGIALVGSAVPAYFISRIRPSDVMRTE